MTIAHHLDEATIMAYAAGTLDEALSVVAACHVAWCGFCRAAVRQAEFAGGELLSELDPADVSPDCRARTLARLDQATLYRLPVPAKAKGELPEPLAQLLGSQDLADLAWRKRAPGVAMVDIKLSPAAHGQLRLMKIAPGMALPEHGHGGEELTLIFSGAYRDALGRFARGDVADLDEAIEHRPVVEADAPCICLVATEAPTRFKSIIARLMQPFLGI